ncbi:MAG: hypothetical protein ACLGH0_06350, partial [Thermoanaerobaculia bacterium]
DEGAVYTRTFTLGLQPLGDQALVTDSSGPASVAAGGGSIVIVTPRRFEEQLRMTATVFRDGSLTTVMLSDHEFSERESAIVWNGSEFVIAWIRAKGEPPDYLEPPPPDQVVAARLSAEGELRTPTPVVVTDEGGHIFALVAAPAANGAALVWQYALPPVTPPSPPAKTYGTIFTGTATPPVVDLGGHRADPRTLVPHENGYLLVRSYVTGGEPADVELEHLTLTADLTIESSGKLPGYQADTFWGAPTFDALGGRVPVIAYARVADEGQYGGTSRIFLRTASDAGGRRRSVR